MNENFYIYFDLQKKQEIIRYRKLKGNYIVDTDDCDILDYYNIDEDSNPYHIIDKSKFKCSEYSNYIVKKLLVDYDADLDILVHKFPPLTI